MSDVEMDYHPPMNLAYADSEADEDGNVPELNDGVESLNDIGDEEIYDESNDEDLEEDEEEVFTSGSESAYEEDEDIRRPPPKNAIIVEKKRGRPKKDPALAGGKVLRRMNHKDKERRKKKKDKGKGKGKGVVVDDEEDDIFDALAGYVGRIPRGGSVVPSGGLLNPDGEGGVPDKPRKPRRARPAHKPTHEVSLLLSKSNLDYIQGNTQQAIEGFLEVIRLDPYIYGAWSSLGTLYEEEGNKDAAQQMKFCALHIEGDADGWRDLAAEYKGAGRTEECLYCLRKAIAKDPQNVMALWEISAEYKAAGKFSKALDAFKRILKNDPDTAHDFSLVADLYPIIMETKQYRFGADALRKAFDWHIQQFTGPDDDSSPEPNTMTMENVINLTDLQIQLDELEEAIVIIRRGQRWLQGRRNEKQWDVIEDDREYDTVNVVRVDKTVDHGEGESHPLDVNLRQRLAMIRLKLGDDDEAKIHVDELLSLEPEAYKDTFVELGNALMGREQWDKALECFAKLQECDAIDDDPEYIMSMGLCHYQLKEIGPATEALRWVVSVQPDNLDARLKLANVLEDSGHKAEALDIVSEVLRIRAATEPSVVGRRGPNIDKPKQTKADRVASQHLNKQVLENQMRQKMQDMWEEVQDAEAALAEGNHGALDRFIYAAGTMIENFRLARSNFTKNRGVVRIDKNKKSAKLDLAGKAKEMQDRLERTLGFEDEDPQAEDADDADGGRYTVVRQTQFYGLGCEEWLALVVKYCCVLMVKNEEELALEILEHVLYAGLFYNRRAELAIRLTIMAGAMRTKSYTTIAENARRLGQQHQFRTEPFHLMLGCMGGGGTEAHTAWQNITLQKFIHRELRLYDYIVKGYKFHYSVSARRWAQEIKIGHTDRLGDDVPLDDEEDGEVEDEEDDQDARSGTGEKTKNGKPKYTVAWQRGKRILIEQPTSKDDEEDDGTEREGSEAPLNVDLDPALLEIPVRPTKNSPHWNWLYGIGMLNGRSFQSALFYLLRAYEYDQYNPLMCFSIAQAYFGRAMVRQADNRNYFIAQGAAFLNRYRKLSDMEDPIIAEEVEYNFGRAFQSIGVVHLAARHYEKVLAMVDERMKEYEEIEDRDMIRNSSMAFEAAHNLMLLYGLSGSMSLVKEASKWLAI